MGQRANGNYGLFISPAGVDANTAADYDLSFSTQLPHGFVVHAKGMVGPLGTGYKTAAFPTLGYVPQVLAAYYDSATGKYYYIQREFTVTGGSGGTYVVSSVTGPAIQVTTNSISMSAVSTSTQAYYGHYVILRMLGGS